MPQIILMVGPSVREKFTSALLNSVGHSLIVCVEDVFGIKDKGDVAFSSLELTHIINEAPVQVEVRYTVGEDEYDRGKPFDPSMEDKKALADRILKSLKAYLKDKEVRDISVWIKPIRDSVFKT